VEWVSSDLTVDGPPGLRSRLGKVTPLGALGGLQLDATCIDANVCDAAAVISQLAFIVPVRRLEVARVPESKNIRRAVFM
jgi:hypothetical protein